MLVRTRMKDAEDRDRMRCCVSKNVAVPCAGLCLESLAVGEADVAERERQGVDGSRVTVLRVT